MLGVRRRALFFVILATSLYTIWTTFKADGVHTLTTKYSQRSVGSLFLTNLASVGNETKPTNKAQNILNFTQRSETVIKFGSTERKHSVSFNQKWAGFPELASSNCTLAFSNAVNNSLFSQNVGRIFPDTIFADSQKCEIFIDKYGFDRYPDASGEEQDFPIAFIILFHKDLDQVLFLLRALYRPHNVYCLSVDIKVSVEFLQAVRSVIKCLPNVFLASKQENIIYAGFTRLMADIHCMNDLLKHPVQWKYVINMPGQQFPLRTNLELVKILKMYNGSNDIEGILGKKRILDRFQTNHTYVKDDKTGEIRIERTKGKNSPPPHGLEIVKGSAYGTYSRPFVEFVFQNSVAQDFLKYCKSFYSPDEYFWATLHHSKSLHVPGGYTEFLIFGCVYVIVTCYEKWDLKKH